MSQEVIYGMGFKIHLYLLTALFVSFSDSDKKNDTEHTPLLSLSKRKEQYAYVCVCTYVFERKGRRMA
jgi:hypothetical protein